MNLEDGYFKELHEVIKETQKALHGVSLIDALYVSRVVTVITAWQEAVQAAASHMENADTTIYLAHREDARRVTKEYIAAVIKAREECVTQLTKRNRRCGRRPSRPMILKTQLSAYCTSPARWPACTGREGRRGISCQHKVHSPEACARQRTGAPDIEHPEHGVPVSDECVVHDS